MIRVIVRTQDNNGAAHVGSRTDTQFKTFDLEAPALETFLREYENVRMSYVTREVIGVEVLDTVEAARG